MALSAFLRKFLIDGVVFPSAVLLQDGANTTVTKSESVAFQALLELPTEPKLILIKLITLHSLITFRTATINRYMQTKSVISRWLYSVCQLTKSEANILNYAVGVKEQRYKKYYAILGTVGGSEGITSKWLYDTMGGKNVSSIIQYRFGAGREHDPIAETLYY